MVANNSSVKAASERVYRSVRDSAGSVSMARADLPDKARCPWSPHADSDAQTLTYCNIVSLGEME
jgi:hypothetical protein